MARKGGKNKKRKQEQSKKGEIKSKKKDGAHPMNQLRFASRTQEKVYDELAIHFLEDHLPKIIDIVPAEVRAKRGETFNPPGKLYKEYIEGINTKKTYVKRLKTFIKWHVVNKGIRALSDINEHSAKEFFKVIEENIGEGKHQYSTKTYDSYVDGTYKLFQALAARPEDAKTEIEGRTFAKPLESAKKMLDRDFKQELRDKVKEYSKEDYKRGSGYNEYQANAIIKQILKEENGFSTKEKLLVAVLVYSTARNDEAQQFDFNCFDDDKGRIEMLKSGMTKQNRGRVVIDVHPVVFELAEQLRKEEPRLAIQPDIFFEFGDKEVRELIEKGCQLAHVKYSGVHDLRKAYVERVEKELYKKIEKGMASKEDLTRTILDQVGAKESLNPMQPVKEKRYYVDKNGKRKAYSVNKKVAGVVVEERKFTYDKLMAMNIEDLADLHMAQQLGHSDPRTTNTYRSEKAAKNRENFRKGCREKRKKGKIE